MCRRKDVALLKEMVAVACADGTWNYDPYLHGMANGMIFALSLADGKAPVFLSAPKMWLKDRTDEGSAPEEAVSDG